jgi:hypothetical protein
MSVFEKLQPNEEELPSPIQGGETAALSLMLAERESGLLRGFEASVRQA